MHATVISVDFIDEAAARAEVAGLAQQVSGMPDFQAGYWIAQPGGKGIAVVVFDSEGPAQALAEQARTAPEGMGTVKTTSVEVGEVIGSA